MEFSAQSGQHGVVLDSKAPLGDGKGITPKESLLMGVAGCTAMDVAALMRKYKQEMKLFEVSAEADVLAGKHPQVFSEIKLVFRVEGNIEKEKLLEAIRLSQTQYCGVSAMISKAVPITYKVFVNGGAVGEGKSHFDF